MKMAEEIQKKHKAKPRTSEAVMPGNQKSTAATQARIWECAKMIANSGYSRLDVIDYITENWDIGQSRAEKYYYAALNLMKPKEEDKERYREILIEKNFNTAETILRKALERNDLTNANAALKILNQMLGVGQKAVEIRDKEGTPEERTITISFTD